MHTTSTIALLIILCLPSRKAFSQDTLSKPIPWRPKMVTFSDFKGRNTHADDKRVAAFSHTRLNVIISDSLSGINKDSLPVRIVAHFYPERSFFKPESFGNKKLLVHEQLHFDIAEIHARRLRQQLAGIKLTTENYQKKIAKEIDNMRKELRVLQWRYDSETTHGLREEEQRRWNDYVYDELYKLNPYSDTSIVIKVMREK